MEREQWRLSNAALKDPVIRLDGSLAALENILHNLGVINWDLYFDLGDNHTYPILTTFVHNYAKDEADE